ncbi:cbb3-type cytochrome oxidase assembly protein CcoS [Shewanella sp.]|uniref:cbb3-type cytochrome oxidase assembly protein CcoS n=1 Tax=Shewanella sp. TaxID=50422 RepID=UPI00356A314A
MSIIYVLIPIAMLFVLIAVGVFFWAVRSEQFDDLNRQGSSILFDEDKPNKAAKAHGDNPSNKDSKAESQ